MRFTKNMDCRQEAISKYQWDNAVLYLDGKITRKELKRRNEMASVCVMCNKMYVRHYGQICDECVSKLGDKCVASIGELPNKEPKWEDWKHLDPSKEPDTFEPSHYHSQPFNCAEVQETIFLTMASDPAPKVMLRAMWASFAVKHLLRCGRKDDMDIELKKAENYLHKARTGEWLKDE